MDTVAKWLLGECSNTGLHSVTYNYSARAGEKEANGLRMPDAVHDEA
jgi:hypothetical protein